VKKFKLVCLTSSILAVSACSDSVSTDKSIDLIIGQKGLTGDPATGRVLPEITDPKAQLGMKLFFTKGLGGDQDSACVTCHHPSLGGGDDLSLSIGTEAVIPDLLGPGRRHIVTGVNYDGGPTVPRNAPTTFNVGLWDEVLFHDGRVESLTKTTGVNGAGGIRTPDSSFGVADPAAGPNLAAAQSRFPVTSNEEMRGHDYQSGNTNAQLRTALEERMKGNYANAEDTLPMNDWQAEFDAVYGAGVTITYSLIADAIGEYERSQVFVDSSWKAYVKGDKSALSVDAKRGAVLFFNSLADGGADCASCHTGDFFTDEKFHVVAMPQVGRGKGDTGSGPAGTDDFGRFRETAVDADKYAFRTPSLLNVEVYGPWGHAGGYTSLEAVVKHHSNPQAAIDAYDFNQLESSVQAANMTLNTQAAMDQLTANRAAGVITPILQDSNLSDLEVEQIVAFLKSLTDPCVKDKSCLAPWVPNAGDANPDGLRVLASDNNGNDL